MREIKFRALFENEDNSKSFQYIEIKNHITGKESFLKLSSDMVQLSDWEQFTGLTDKNGREIYEGDVCKCKGQDDNCVVHYAEMCACFIVLPYWKSYKCWSDDMEDDAEDYFLYDFIRVEVIGNIHENPELLEDK